MRGCWHVTCVLRCLAVFLKVVTKCSILLQGIGKGNMNTRSEIVHLSKRIYHYRLGWGKFVSGSCLNHIVNHVNLSGQIILKEEL